MNKDLQPIAERAAPILASTLLQAVPFSHIGLFEGIGGFSLAAKQMGWVTKAWCEINPFCQKVLKYHFPEAEGFGDITTTEFTKYANTIDIITGGFPCQPYSMAGKRKGKEDERHLFPHMLRAIREVQPRWVVGENVPGLINWERGLVLHEIKTDLENEGFEVFPPVIIPACAKDAPHRRDRIWIIAHSKSNGNRRRIQRMESKNGSEWEPEEYRENNVQFGNDGEKWDAAHSGLQRQKEQKQQAAGVEQCGRWDSFPTQSPICSGDDGLPTELDGITFSKWRNESVKAYGNAIVPAIALEIFKALQGVSRHCL